MWLERNLVQACHFEVSAESRLLFDNPQRLPSRDRRKVNPKTGESTRYCRQLATSSSRLFCYNPLSNAFFLSRRLQCNWSQNPFWDFSFLQRCFQLQAAAITTTKRSTT